MSRLLRSFRAPLVLGVLLLVGAPSALAAPTISSLRVEAGGDALSPGTSYVHDTARIRTSRLSGCDGSGRVSTVPGPTALGLLDAAADAGDRDLRPLRISDKFSFGLFVCGIGSNVGNAERFWSYKVNRRLPEVGADQFRVKRGDEVLWYFTDTRNNVNTGDQLVLFVKARSRSGRSFGVSVLAYDAQGVGRPAAGARIVGGGGAVTGPNGQTTIRATGRLNRRLRAIRGNDIASEPQTICISPRLSECPRRRGETIVGTDGRDRVTGTRGGDDIRTGRGRDRVNVTGGDRDRVRCGTGSDLVVADRGDRVARDCERVVRRRVVGISPVEQ